MFLRFVFNVFRRSMSKQALIPEIIKSNRLAKFASVYIRINLYTHAYTYIHVAAHVWSLFDNYFTRCKLIPWNKRAINAAYHEMIVQRQYWYWRQLLKISRVSGSAIWVKNLFPRSCKYDYHTDMKFPPVSSIFS